MLDNTITYTLTFQTKKEGFLGKLELSIRNFVYDGSTRKQWRVSHRLTGEVVKIPAFTKHLIGNHHFAIDINNTILMNLIREHCYFISLEGPEVIDKNQCFNWLKEEELLRMFGKMTHPDGRLVNHDGVIPYTYIDEVKKEIQPEHTMVSFV